MKEKDEKLWNKVAGRTDKERSSELLDHLRKSKKKKGQTHYREDFRKFLHSIGIHRSTGDDLQYDGGLELYIRKCKYCDKLMVIKVGISGIPLLKVVAFILSWVGLGTYVYCDITGPIKYLVFLLGALGLTYTAFKQVSECD